MLAPEARVGVAMAARLPGILDKPRRTTTTTSGRLVRSSRSSLVAARGKATSGLPPVGGNNRAMRHGSARRRASWGTFCCCSVLQAASRFRRRGLLRLVPAIARTIFGTFTLVRPAAPRSDPRCKQRPSELTAAGRPDAADAAAAAHV